MAETKEEYKKRAEAIGGVVGRNMTSDPNATKKGIGMLGSLLFPYGLEGSVPQREKAVQAGLTASGQPLPLDVNERLMQDRINREKGIGVPLTKSDIASQAEQAVPVATVENAPAAAAGINGQPWSRERRMKELNLNEGRIERGIGPGGTDVLTNRNTPFKDYKTLPEEAAGSPEAQVKKNLTELASGRGPGALKAAGILAGAEAQKDQAAIERERMKQNLIRLDEDRAMKEEDKINQIALALSPTTKTKDITDIEEKVTETKDLSLYEAMLKDGTVKGPAAQRLAKAIEMVKGNQKKKLVVNDIVDGMKFKGGDPAKKENWEKI